MARRVGTAACLAVAAALLATAVAYGTPISVTAGAPGVAEQASSDTEVTYHVTASASAPEPLMRWHLNVWYQGLAGCEIGAAGPDGGPIGCTYQAPAVVDFSTGETSAVTYPGNRPLVLILPRQAFDATYHVYADWYAYHLFDPSWLDPYRGRARAGPTVVVVPARTAEPASDPDDPACLPPGAATLTLAVATQQQPICKPVEQPPYKRAATTGFLIAGFIGAGWGLEVAILKIVAPTLALTPYIALGAAVMGVAAIIFTAIRIDPPDPNYRREARLRFVKLPPLPRGLDRDFRWAFRKWLTAKWDQVAAARGFLTSLERAQGAQLAGDGGWEYVHASNAGEFAHVLRRSVDEEIFFQRVLARELRRLPRVSASASRVRRVIDGLAKAPNARRLVRALRKGGLSSDQAVELLDQVRSQPARAFNLRRDFLPTSRLAQLKTLRRQWGQVERAIDDNPMAFV